MRTSNCQLPSPLRRSATGRHCVKSPMISTLRAFGARTRIIWPVDAGSTTNDDTPGAGVPSSRAADLSERVGLVRRRRLNVANRPPGKPWVKSTGYVPASSTMPTCGASHVTTATLPQLVAVPPSAALCAPPRTPTLAPSSSLGDTQRVDSCVSTYRIVSSTCIGATEPTMLNPRLLNHAPASEASTVRHVEPSHVRPAPPPTHAPPVEPIAWARARASV